MPKEITRVSWGASGVPDGLKFNESTGTFTGTALQDGEYVVPVRVETNYGSDEKDVRVLVEGKKYPVYAIGRYAALWSGNASADENGLRKLEMPQASRLVSLHLGFGAKVGPGRWYVCGNNRNYYGIYDVEYPDFLPSRPVEYPVSGVKELCGGHSVGGSSTSSTLTYDYFMYLKNTGEGQYYVVTHYADASVKYDVSALLSGVEILHSGFGAGLMYKYSSGYGSKWDGAIESRDDYGGKSYVADEGVKRLIKQADAGRMHYLTHSGLLWQVSSNNVIERLFEGVGVISEVWSYATSNQAVDVPNMYVLPSGSKSLYAIGNNQYYMMGLPESRYYAELTEVGEYEVKRISGGSGGNFLLTSDGAVYHTGLGISGLTGAHEGFERIL